MTALYDAMEEYLASCQVAVATTPGGLPACTYVDAGPPAWDTIPSLIVHSGGPVVADTSPLAGLNPGHRAAIYGEVFLVALTATILRCAPPLSEEGSLPSASAHQQAALETSSDLWAIWNHLKTAKRNGTLFAPVEREFFLDPAVPVNQQGGACGWQITVRTQLDGYTP